MTDTGVDLEWKCHTPNLLREILDNPTTGILKKPLSIFGRLLAEVGERASELDDPKLNILMMRLTIYECADLTLEHVTADSINKIVKEQRARGNQ